MFAVWWDVVCCGVRELSLNCDRSKHMVVCFAWKCPPVSFSVPEFPPVPAIKLGGSEVEHVSQVNLLGVILTNNLKWQGPIDSVCGKGSSRLYFLRTLRRAGVDPKDIVAINVALICSILEYACKVWHSGPAVQRSDQLGLVQRGALRVAYPDHSYRVALQITGLDTLRDRRDRLCRTFFANVLEPTHILHKFVIACSTTAQLRR